MNKLLKIASLSTLMVSSIATACTWISVDHNDSDAKVVVRTEEFPTSLNSEFIVIPRNTELDGITSKYGIYGFNAFGIDNGLIEGANEHGLTISVLWYDAKDKGYQKDGKLTPHTFSYYALANAKTVAELVALINEHGIGDIAFEAFGMTLPLHWAVTDETGASIVIEPTVDGIKIYDNNVNVMTNAPSFDWHLQNLANYVNVGADQVHSATFGSETVKATGVGSGGLGLPGDFTPVSRFIRAAHLVDTAVPVEKSSEAVISGWNIINNINISKGNTYTKPIAKGDDGLNYNQWTSAIDTTTCEASWRTWNDPRIVGVNACEIGFDNDDIVRFELNYDAPVTFSGTATRK